MSDIVTLNIVESSIGIITLSDKENHNLFSEDLYQSLKNKLLEAQQNNFIRVLIIQGNESIFSHGIKTSSEPRLETAMYALLLNNELPIIAVMQGEAYGAGFALGCYADIIYLSEEAHYSANFSDAIPTAAASYIIQEKIGLNMGSEMLYTGDKYQGINLKQHNISTKIESSAEIVKRALEKAQDLREKPRVSLTLLKQHLTRKIREDLKNEFR